MKARRPRVIRRGLHAAAWAAVLSGAPSTIHALATGGEPLQATLAAGRMVAPRAADPRHLVLAAALAHGALSVGWGVALAATLPERRTVAWGALAGFGIGILDLLVIGRHIPAIRDLAIAPQLADHVAFGLVAGYVLRDGTRAPGP